MYRLAALIQTQQDKAKVGALALKKKISTSRRIHATIIQNHAGLVTGGSAPRDGMPGNGVPGSRMTGGRMTGGRMTGGRLRRAPSAPALRWAGAGLACLSVVMAAACQGGPPSHRVLPPRLARVTITIGNLTFTSGATAAGTRQSKSADVVTRSAAGNRAAGNMIDRRPDLGIGVSVSGGALSSVTVTSASGRTVPGSPGTDGTTWHTTWALAPSQAYHVTAAALNGQHAKTVVTGTFRTMTPQRTFSASTTIGTHQVFGVGMPIMVTFSHPVTDRAAVERALEVRSSKPVIGAWYWMSSTQVWFRTKTYWPAHTRVWFDAHLKGVRGAPGIYGVANLAQQFRIGSSLVAVASTASHHMKVWYNGHFKGDWPISTGQPGLDTPNGHYLSFDMGNPVDMNSASFGVMPGDPGYYNVMVYDSVKFTADGDYVHSAPWSVGEQGYVNVSHGCVNVAPDNAAWYYDHSLLGDPISVVGSPAPPIWGDGWTIWFLSWRKLLAGSGTGQAVLVDSSGSQFLSAATTSPNRMRAMTRF
jgi:lipoprotein-anchoring transpeptidase ErfK/SrfK